MFSLRSFIFGLTDRSDGTRIISRNVTVVAAAGAARLLFWQVASRDRNAMRTIILALILAACTAALPPQALADTSYAEQAGRPAGVYRNEALEYQLDLGSTPYVVVDMTEQIPDASYAAMRFDPLVFSMTIAEDLGTVISVEQYADIVRTSTLANLSATAGDITAEDIRVIGERSVDGERALQLGFTGSIDDVEATYVITVVVRDSMAYQLTSFASGATSAEVEDEANTLADAFSFVGEAGARAAAVDKNVDAYESAAFAYTLNSDPDTWFPWAGYLDDYPYADLGALGAKGYGAVMMPVCWQGAAPNRNALLDTFMEQYGETYPSPFISNEQGIEKDGVLGLYMSGTEMADGDLYLYEFRMVSNEQCAYMFGTWGPDRLADTRVDTEKLWDSIRLVGAPTVFEASATRAERAANAHYLNRLGLHYLDARSYREAFRYLEQATDLDPSESNYAMNSLRVLSELDAYQEARDWLQPRLEHYPDDLFVKSWDAWLAYQTGDTDKAVTLYKALFEAGYREDEEFRIYMELLADRGEWEALDAGFAAYAGDELNDSMKLLKASVLSQRDRYDEALGILDELGVGRPFNAELVYTRIEVYDAMGNYAEILTLAESLIGNGYASLESWFWKGYAEFYLRSYLKSRESFETARGLSPTTTIVKEYLAEINSILGEGDNASIGEPVEPVELPSSLQAFVEQPGYGNTVDGYGAFFLHRIIGFEFDGGDSVSKTQYQQIKILDAQGMEQFSTLEFDFDPAFEQMYVNRLVVRDEQGVVIAEGDRDSYYVTTTVDGFEASTEQTAHLPVPGLAPGVSIEVVVSKTIGVETGQMPLELQYLSGGRPIEYSAVFVSGNAGNLAWRSFGIDEPRRDGDTLIWNMADPVVYRWEPMQPYYDRLLPWVYMGSTDASWDEAGAAYYAKIIDKLDYSRIADNARRLVRGVDDDTRKIEVLSAYVQEQLRYEAIEFGRRAYIPKTARETLRDRYGDCKDHAVLLYSMLNAVDVPAELALVNLNQQVLEELPNVDQFDHMIVSVPQGEHRLFIDTTDKNYRLGAKPPRYMAGNHALIIGENSELVEIPDFELGDSSLHVEREVEKTVDNELRVNEVGIFSGYQAADLRGQLRDIEPSEMQATLQRWVASRYTDAIVDDAFVDNLLAADAELIVELVYRLPIDDGESFKLPSFFEVEFLEYSRVADRRFVFDLPVPFTVSAVTTVLQSAEQQIDIASKKADKDESKFANWSRKVESSEESWVFSLEYTGQRSEYAADDYGDFAEFHRKLVSTIEQPLVVD